MHLGEIVRAVESATGNVGYFVLGIVLRQIDCHYLKQKMAMTINRYNETRSQFKRILSMANSEENVQQQKKQNTNRYVRC